MKGIDILTKNGVPARHLNIYVLCGYDTDFEYDMYRVMKLKELGWQPMHTPEKSIKDYVDWIKSSGFDVGGIAEKIGGGHGRLV